MIYLVLVGYILLAATGNLLIKVNKRETLPTMYALAFWGFVLGSVIFGVFWIIDGNPFAYLSWGLAGLIALRSLTGILNLFCWIKVVKYMPVSIAEPLGLARMFPLLAIAYFWFGDPAPLVAIILAVAIFVCCMLMKKARTVNVETISAG